MSEHNAPRRGNDEQAIDHLLAGSGLEDANSIRAELLELRSLGSTAPLPSEAVRALMTAGPVAVDELAARRRRKHRSVVVALAVAVSLAGGATAAAASDGGIPGAIQHIGAAIGSVAGQLAPTPVNVPQQGGPAGSPSEPEPIQAPQQLTPVSSPPGPASAVPSLPVPSPPGPASAAPKSPADAVRPDPRPTPGGGVSPQAPEIPPRIDPGNISIPTPPALPITPPDLPIPAG
ncbi:hypothetical protein ACFRJ9_07440 [Paenarthrobacter sp. NPDC056912]|uniref:hypothetical protein n=1 Tax=Paenarthrobacter sp. NPDC056912 TaxID=3345965 RepID=UPI003672FBF1